MSVLQALTDAIRDRAVEVIDLTWPGCRSPALS